MVLSFSDADAGSVTQITRSSSEWTVSFRDFLCSSLRWIEDDHELVYRPEYTTIDRHAPDAEVVVRSQYSLAILTSAPVSHLTHEYDSCECIEAF
jgi:hypothetical protein